MVGSETPEILDSCLTVIGSWLPARASSAASSTAARTLALRPPGRLAKGCAFISPIFPHDRQWANCIVNPQVK
jgi:hypothetical protein